MPIPTLGTVARSSRWATEPYADYLEAIHDPCVVHGMIEDYRAGLAVDHLHDAKDRATGRRIEVPDIGSLVIA